MLLNDVGDIEKILSLLVIYMFSRSYYRYKFKVIVALRLNFILYEFFK